jgi:hypothetical protein
VSQCSDKYTQQSRTASARGLAGQRKSALTHPLQLGLEPNAIHHRHVGRTVADIGARIFAAGFVSRHTSFPTLSLVLGDAPVAGVGVSVIAQVWCGSHLYGVF